VTRVVKSEGGANSVKRKRDNSVVPITEAERLRWKRGLCRICGQPGKWRETDAKRNILKGARRALLCNYHQGLATAAMNTPEICAERGRLWRESVTLRLWCKGLIVESDNDWLRSPSLSKDVGAEPAKNGPKSEG
jgi:hypothetical protein